jgi:hypothetical protein
MRYDVYVLTPKSIRKVHPRPTVLTQGSHHHWIRYSLISRLSKLCRMFLMSRIIKSFRIKGTQHIGRNNWHKVVIHLVFININLALVEVETLDNALVQVDAFMLGGGLLRRNDLEGVLYHAHTHFFSYSICGLLIVMWV